MPKEKPYPLRLEKDQEALVQKICAETNLSKAFVLRTAIDYGLVNVDWSKYQRPELSRSKPHAWGNSRSEASVLNDSPADKNSSLEPRQTIPIKYNKKPRRRANSEILKMADKIQAEIMKDLDAPKE